MLNVRSAAFVATSQKEVHSCSEAAHDESELLPYRREPSRTKAFNRKLNYPTTGII
jgi:hypothetical protein